MRYYFAWLGSKRAAKRNVAEPGSLLDRAANANLPVPAGGILLHNFYTLALEEGMIVEKEGQITAESPNALHDLLYNLAHFPKIEGEMVIRPLHATHVGPASRPVKADNPNLLSELLCEGYAAQNGRHDLLLTTLPNMVQRGTAVSPQNALVDQLIFADGKTELPRLGLWQRPEDTLLPHAQRVQMLLRGLRRTFGDAGWEIAWVDDGRICWLWEIKKRG